MSIIINEEEKRRLLSLYEQKTKVSAFKLDRSTLPSIDKSVLKDLEKEFFKSYTNSKAEDYLKNELDITLMPDKSVSKLIDLGITPYVFAIPNYVTGNSIPTTGVNFKIKNTPFNFSLNLGTDPKELFNSMKWSMMGLNVNF